MYTSIAIVSTKLNGFNYFYLKLIILFNIYHLFTYKMKWLQVLQFKTNYSIQNYSFICIQLNGSKYCYVSLTVQLNIRNLFTHLSDQTVLFLPIQFSSSHLFGQSLNVKQFYLTEIGPYQVLPTPDQKT